MKMDLECVACLLNQTYKALSRINVSREVKEKLLRKALEIVASNSWSLSSPQLYFRIYKLIRLESGINDPYQHDKKTWNKKALELYDELKQAIIKSNDPLYTSLKLAIAGNIIDFGALDRFDVEKTIQESLEKPLTIDDYLLFKEKLRTATSILYFMDNAGEAIFDRLFIEEIVKYGISKVCLVVREEPFINDVTIADLDDTGILSISEVEVLTMPVDPEKFEYYEREGVIKSWIKSNDLVIAKGQGNLEILDKYEDIFFALIVKCNAVARYLGVNVGDMIFRYNI
mgnify:CR=1 FL=1